MKKLLLFTFLSIFAFLMVSCHQEKEQTAKPLEIKDEVRYKLFPTENMWTFLELDTQTGKIWQVQYSVDENSYRGEVDINTKNLASSEEAKNGRFTLYPTKNMFNYILLDQVNGKRWQVQWSIQEENRLIIPL